MNQQNFTFCGNLKADFDVFFRQAESKLHIEENFNCTAHYYCLDEWFLRFGSFLLNSFWILAFDSAEFETMNEHFMVQSLTLLHFLETCTLAGCNFCVMDMCLWDYLANLLFYRSIHSLQTREGIECLPFNTSFYWLTSLFGMHVLSFLCRFSPFSWSLSCGFLIRLYTIFMVFWFY